MERRRVAARGRVVQCRLCADFFERTRLGRCGHRIGWKELSLLVDAVGLPKIALRTTRAIDRFYRLERVQRPDWCS
ncbi:hypothetical protein AXO1947_17380 [Xanthomonas oryzae pv. oryzae]|nr:hypothetical protein AXO1947_17380 [Xanthomonas oryzae pv. oryzae]